MEGVVNEMGEINYGLVIKTFAIMVKVYKSYGMELNVERVIGKMLKYGCLYILRMYLIKSVLDVI